MKLQRCSILLACILLTGILHAQDSVMKFSCPLKFGISRIIRASDKDYQRSSEYGMMISSKLDTTMFAVHDGAIVSVLRNDDGKYDVVLQFKSYYFWYAGVADPVVKRGAKVKEGDIIGNYKPGDMLELLMFQQEEPVNPRKFLKCN